MPNRPSRTHDPSLKELMDEAKEQLEKERRASGTQVDNPPPNQTSPSPLPPPVGSVLGAADAPNPPMYRLYQATAIFGLVVWAQMVIEYMAQSSVLDKSNALVTVYLTLLGTYMGSKEMTRSPGPDQPDNRLVRGEFFVLLWIATTGAIYFIARYPNLRHEIVPKDLLTAFSGVLGLYLTGKTAKRYLPKGMLGKIPGAAGSTASTATESAIIDVLKHGSAEGMTANEIASALDAAPSTVRARLAPMARAGKVVRVAAGPGDPHTRYKLP